MNRILPTAAGGIQPAIFSEELLRNWPARDFVLQGEGEENKVQPALALEKGPSLAHFDSRPAAEVCSDFCHAQ